MEQEAESGRDWAGFWGLRMGHFGAIFVPDEPIQPIDPAAWVSHSAALTGTFPAYPGSSSMSTITSGSSLPDGEPPAHLIPPSQQKAVPQWSDPLPLWERSLTLVPRCLLCQAVKAGVSLSIRTWHR